ncbi:MAG: hypothetical protein IT280_10255 [Ignavibacteria bacterium]|nr:hypothetical protein [Ignavibacteria bacterium]
MNTILEKVLKESSCTYDKYLLKIPYIKTKYDITEHIFITPVVTVSGNNILIISRNSSDNWFSSTSDLGDLLYFLEKNYNYRTDNNCFIFHFLIEKINFEMFYMMCSSTCKIKERLSLTDLKKVLG